MKRPNAVLGSSAKGGNKAEQSAARLGRRMIDLAGKAEKVRLTVDEAERQIDNQNRMINQESKAI